MALLLVVAAGTQLKAAESSPAPLEFMPEIQRVLAGGGGLGERVYLGFASGEVAVERRQEDPRYSRRLHRDLVLDLTPGLEQWTGIGLEVTPAGEDAWNKPPNRLMADLADNLAPPLPTMQVTPGVWFFKTGDGQFGLMRVIGFDEPRPGSKGMKIVYKLAHTARPVKAVEKELPVPERIQRFLDGEPSTTGTALEIWEQGPDGKLALRGDLVRTAIPSAASANAPTSSQGEIYYLKSADRFYLQWPGGLGAGAPHWYGPFAGDPVKVLGL